jgi:hypothetical protein
MSLPKRYKNTIEIILNYEMCFVTVSIVKTIEKLGYVIFYVNEIYKHYSR